MSKLYFAGPLFNQAELKFNENICKKLESIDISVFLPQRDGVEKNKHPYQNMTKEERRHAMFTMDRNEIIAADIFLIILDGRVPDEGACVELGIAYGQKYFMKQKKILVGLRTDKRAVCLGCEVNPMISQALDKICVSLEDLLEYLKDKLKH